jgi:hypothetical protein
MDVAIAHYVRFKQRESGYVSSRSYQNFFVAESRNFGGVIYPFAPFTIAGNTSTRGGDAMQASLVSVPNDITVSLFAEAVSSRWLLEVKTVLLSRTSGTFFTESSTITEEIWACTGGNEDHEKATITLASPLDAARAQIPKRVLSSYLVGALPSTGAIYSS